MGREGRRGGRLRGFVEGEAGGCDGDEDGRSVGAVERVQSGSMACSEMGWGLVLYDSMGILVDDGAGNKRNVDG